MSRIVSLVVLVAVLLVIGALFFHVMIGFLLPLFLAVLLAIMFGPLHRRFQARFKGHNQMAAGLTTSAVMLILLVLLASVLLPAISQGIGLYQGGVDIDVTMLAQAASRFTAKLGLEVPADEIAGMIKQRIERWLAPVVLSTTQYLGEAVIGLGIMVIALYYFLADGPAMIRTLMRLSPLEDKYEEQLIDQFVNIARAMVLATVLSALVQGILCGIGLYFAGVGMVFLLTALSMLLAMVPFVGTAAVWVPACLWLYFHEERLVAALFLAVWSLTVVSLADNVIKPMVLHGRAQLHPLLALLSVLGGLQAMGPIGIFIGPMVVVFLQTLLNILHSELAAMDRGSSKASGGS